MEKTFIPEDYKSILDVYDTQTAIGFIKRCFEEALTGSLKLKEYLLHFLLTIVRA